MTAFAAVLLLLQAVTAGQRNPEIPVQLGVSVSTDTVTVGERFVAVLRLRVPKGATVQFPTTTDSTAASSLTGMELIGKPAIQTLPDTAALMMSAAYRLAAWDVGPQRLALSDIVIQHNGQTGYVAVSDWGVFVRSVLPDDSTLRVPKPARPPIEIGPFNWLPILAALAAIVAAGLLWRLWIWYKRRRNAPVDPFTAAQREFDRIEAMKLTQSGEARRHAAMMSDVMRDYLAARVPEIERSHTSSELIAAGGRVHSAAKGLGELLWQADLVKFAAADISPADAERVGATAREIVQSVEDFLVGEEERDVQDKAAA